MSTNYNNIDEMLSDSFEDFSSAPSPSVRAKMSKRIRHFNFFKFSAGSFNIFYLVAIILGTSLIFSYSSGVFNNDSTKITNTIIKDNHQSDQMIEKTDNNTVTNSNIKTETKNNNKNTETVISAEKSDIKFSPELISDEKDITVEQTQVVESNQEDVTFSTEKIIIYDTVVETEKIIITDTINKEVHKTVEVKKNRNNKN